MSETFQHTGCLFTEKAAARMAKPGAMKQAMEVLAFIRSSGGCTIEECHLGTGIRQSSVCGRRRWLEDQGMVKDSGKKRPTTSGSPATVWEVTK